MITCDAGYTKCGGFCRDLANDPEHCGGCANFCVGTTNGTATCTNGMCGFTCNAGYTQCGDHCANLQTDSTNCGTCMNECTMMQTCISGSCAD
jgi:hypothetical protein